ncbi:AraC family transcriptional regulator [Collimonas sp.]|uniref:AraC family transcriptional regulator n=1 Tax=Collimonas sp. TaxID=1963772 RepID=UPI002B839584|nr:AraC family transcriptional regulator [Collimonas sp.]HWX02930.1 AraC family transcriptional regulator [Collimonas sp.]
MRTQQEVDMHPTSPVLSLAPLYRRRVFQSSKKVDCHVQVAKELSAHDLYWKGDNVDTILFKATIRKLQVFMLKYGAEVVVRPKLFDGFVLVHMTLSGIAEIESDGQKVCIPQGHTAVIAPRRNLRLWWQAGSEQLILKVPTALFDEIGARSGAGVPAMPSALLLPPHLSGHWNFLIQSLLGVLDLSVQTEEHALWINHFELGAAQFLCSQMVAMPEKNPATAAIVNHQLFDGVSDSGKFKRLDALEQYIQGRLCAPVSLTDMARAAGVSVRSLNALCHQHHGVAPMDLLRNIRLDAVRQRLLSRPAANITEIAFEFGFAHLGRFSAYYRRRFGELPKQTRACQH